jgi:ATP-dependent protease ClpP protease subunit
MKKVLVLFAVLALAVGVVYANPDMDTEDSKEPINVCPVFGLTGAIEDCMECHVTMRDGDGYKFGLKEVPKYAQYDPPLYTSIIDHDGEPAAYFCMRDIDHMNVQKMFVWVFSHPEIKHVVMEIHSPGGSLFDSQRIVGYMDLAKSKGIIVETQCYGFGASAGFYVMVNGSKGYRSIIPSAFLMWHELRVGQLFKISTPSGTEDEAEDLRRLQNNINQKIASVSNMTLEEIDEWIHKRDAWITGKDSIEKGFADKLIGE